MCNKFAAELKCVVIDCDYRKSPENKFPAAFEDGEDAVNFVLANPGRFDLRRLSLGGSSAGGLMALSLSMKYKRDVVRACFALYPVTVAPRLDDIKGCKKAITTKYRSGEVIPPFIFKLFFKGTMSTLSDLRSPLLNPMLGDVKLLPDHVLLACGDADTLVHDSEDMMGRIHANGTDNQRRFSSFMSIPNEAHALNNFPNASESYEWRDKLYANAMSVIRASWSP